MPANLLVNSFSSGTCGGQIVTNNNNLSAGVIDFNLDTSAGTFCTVSFTAVVQSAPAILDCASGGGIINTIDLGYDFGFPVEQHQFGFYDDDTACLNVNGAGEPILTKCPSSEFLVPKSV